MSWMWCYYFEVLQYVLCISVFNSVYKNDNSASKIPQICVIFYVYKLEIYDTITKLGKSDYRNS